MKIYLHLDPPLIVYVQIQCHATIHLLMKVSVLEYHGQSPQTKL